jgi:glycosyltransferase involved in cell wall biosynthesis
MQSKGLSKRILVFWSFIISSLFALPFIGRIDVVWAANPDVFILIPAIVFGGVKRKPIVSNVDDLIIEDLYDLDLVERESAISRIIEFFARVLFSKVNYVTPISPGYVMTLIKYGVDKRKIEVIRGGVDLDNVNPISRQMKKEKFTVLYSGGFSIAYDFEQLLRAANKKTNK